MFTDRRTKLTTAIAGFALLGALSAAPAHAGEVSPLIDPNAKGELVITKLSMPIASGLNNDGTAQTIDTQVNRPLAGVTFTLWPVMLENPTGTAVDLSTEAGWEAARAVKLADIAADLATDTQQLVGAGQNRTTAADGLATFSNLPRGLYYVAETATPAGVVPAEPFLVTIPMTSPAANDWLYTVYAYPKNDEVSVVKEVDTSAVQTLNDWARYTIKADIPQYSSPTQQVSAFRIQDVHAGGAGVLAADLSAWDAADNADGLRVTLTAGASANAVDLVAGTDFTVAAGDAKPIYFTIDFTAAGLEKLSAAAADQQVRVTYRARLVTGDSDAYGEVSATNPLDLFGNRALLFPDRESITSNTPSTDEVQFQTGMVKFTKVSDTGQKLNGAEFVVYPANAAGDCLLSESAITMFHSTASGSGPAFTVLGEERDRDENLTGRYSTGELLFGKYCLVETKAPLGYELQTTPIKFTVGSTTTWALEANQIDANAPEVVNYPHNAGFDLPLTGAVGVAGMSIGALVLGAAVLFVLRARRASRAA